MIQQNYQPTKFTIQTMQEDIERASIQKKPLSSISPSEFSKKQNLSPPKPPLENQSAPQKHFSTNRINEVSSLLKEGQSLYENGSHLDALEKFEQAIKMPASWWLKYKISKAIKDCKKTIFSLEKERNEKQKKLETQLKKQMSEKIEQKKPIAMVAIDTRQEAQQETEKEKIKEQKIEQAAEQRIKIEAEQQAKIKELEQKLRQEKENQAILEQRIKQQAEIEQKNQIEISAIKSAKEIEEQNKRKELELEIQKTKEIMTQKTKQIEMEAEARAIEIIAHKEAEQQAKIKELEQKLRQEKENQAILEQRIKQQAEIEQKNQIEISAIKSAKEIEEQNKRKMMEQTTTTPTMPTIPSPIIPIKPAAPPKQTAILPTPPITPSPAATIKKEKIFKFTKLFSTKTVVFALIILLLLSGGIYWFNFQKVPSNGTQPQPPAPVEPQQPAAPPSPIFKVESSETILLSENSDRNNFINKLKEINDHEQEIGEFKQIILEKENTSAKQYFPLMTLSQILEIELSIPRCRDNLDIDINQKCIGEQIDATNYMLFIYGQREISQNPFEAGQGRNRLGIIIKSSETTLKGLEKNIQEISSVLLLREKPATDNDLVFQENTYKDIAIRYINLPNKYLSIDYAIVDNHLIIATSQESMYAAIDRLLIEKR